MTFGIVFHDKEGDHLGIDLLAKSSKEHFLTAGEVAFPKPFDHSEQRGPQIFRD